MGRVIRAHVLRAMLAAAGMLGCGMSNSALAQAPTPWTGCYIGGSGGMSWGSSSWSNPRDGFLGTVQGGGVNIGGQTGCDWQFGQFVLGGVFDGGVSSFEGERTALGWDFIGRIQGYQWVAARVGVTSGPDNSGLWYLKGGVTATQYSITSIWPEMHNAYFHNNITLWGPGVGVGFEHFIGSNFTVATEFSGYYHGNSTVNLTSNTPIVPLYTVQLGQSVTYSWTFKLNYRFNAVASGP
jgi:outer membrane immunogenic protein